jgi:site-specific DNA-methyltransferase (adenine-specific)
MLKPYYQDSAVTIYHGDCREILLELPEIDMVLTDPPYGLENCETDKNNYESFSDNSEEVTKIVKNLLWFFKGKRFVMTPGQKQMFKYPEPKAIGAFYYPAGTGSCSWGFVGWQPIFYYGKDPYLQDMKGRVMNSFSSTEMSEKNGHPCPKPIKAWTWLLNRTSRINETILDPFMGSGTTLRAAKDLNRHAIGIEIEEKYCEIAARRMAQEVFDFTITKEV